MTVSYEVLELQLQLAQQQLATEHRNLQATDQARLDAQAEAKGATDSGNAARAEVTRLRARLKSFELAAATLPNPEVLLEALRDTRTDGA